MSGQAGSLDPNDHQMIFMGGLHRSGTSFLARMLASHPEASGLTGTNVAEDEGQLVQNVYDAARLHGGPGKFAFSPEMHLTENSASCKPESTAALMRAWGPYWDLSKRVLVEKSPPNLTKSRYLQALFPDAYFVMIMRHPIAVAEATAKWTKTSRLSLVSHWVAAHEIMAADLPFLKRVMTLRYEDVVADPRTEFHRVLEFLGLPPAETTEHVRSGVNEQYYSKWQRGMPWARRSGANATERYQARVERFGYSLVPPHVADRLPTEFG
jgi:hypothetical protein